MIYTVCHAIYAKLHDLVNFIVICISLLKIAGDGNFCLLFGKSYWHLVSYQGLNVIADMWSES